VAGKAYPFGNDGRDNTTLLPSVDSSGNAVKYWEYDVNPFVKGVNRVLQRPVTGSDRMLRLLNSRLLLHLGPNEVVGMELVNTNAGGGSVSDGGSLI
jgi:hypothetical protein